MQRDRAGALTVLLGRASHLLAIVAGVLLVAMVGIIAAAVGARYFLAAPILGVNELVQLNAVALAMLALPYATATHAHVRADLLDPALGRLGRATGDILTRLLSLVVFWHLVTRAWDKMRDAMEYGDATNMLSLPIWPFYSLIALGVALCALIFIAEIVQVLFGGALTDV